MTKAKIFAAGFAIGLAIIFAAVKVEGDVKAGLVVGCIAVAVLNVLVWIVAALATRKAVRP